MKGREEQWGDEVEEVHAWLSCPALCNPMDYSLPESSVSGIFSASILQWVVISSFRGSSWPRTWVSLIFCIGRKILCHLGIQSRGRSKGKREEKNWIIWLSKWWKKVKILKKKARKKPMMFSKSGIFQHQLLRDLKTSFVSVSFIWLISYPNYAKWLMFHFTTYSK